MPTQYEIRLAAMLMSAVAVILAFVASKFAKSEGDSFDRDCKRAAKFLCWIVAFLCAGTIVLAAIELVYYP